MKPKDQNAPNEQVRSANEAQAQQSADCRH